MTHHLSYLLKPRLLSQILRNGNDKASTSFITHLNLTKTRNFQACASRFNDFNLKSPVDPKTISHSWDKPTTKLSYNFQSDDIKKLQSVCGPVSSYLMIGRFPLTITPGDLFRLNQTNSTFQNTIEDFYFERSRTLDFTGFCHIKFSEPEAAMQLCFDIFNISGLVGGKTVVPKFESKERYINYKQNSISQDGGAGSTVFISGLPALTIASDLVSWIAPYRIPLAFDGNVNLAIKPINSSKAVRNSNRPSFSGRMNQQQQSPSSTFIIRLTSPSEAHHMVSLLHNSIFKPSTFGNRYHVSLKILY